MGAHRMEIERPARRGLDLAGLGRGCLRLYEVVCAVLALSLVAYALGYLEAWAAFYLLRYLLGGD